MLTTYTQVWFDSSTVPNLRWSAVCPLNTVDQSSQNDNHHFSESVSVRTIASGGSKQRKIEILPALPRTEPSPWVDDRRNSHYAGNATEDASDIIENLERDTMGAS